MLFVTTPRKLNIIQDFAHRIFLVTYMSIKAPLPYVLRFDIAVLEEQVNFQLQESGAVLKLDLITN